MENSMKHTYVDVLFTGVSNDYGDQADTEYLVAVSQFIDVPGMISFTSVDQIDEVIDALQMAKNMIENYQYGY
jgi:hypothetical protein